MWCYIVLLFIFGQIIVQTNAVNMCRNGSTVSTNVSATLLSGTGVNGCYCSVKLLNTIRSDKPKITFEVKAFSGCKYELVILYKNTNQRFSCSNNSTIYHGINKTDEIKLYLESTTSYQDDTTFEITASVSGGGNPKIELECFLPNTTSDSTTQSTPRSSSESTLVSMSLTNIPTPESTSGSSSAQPSVSMSSVSMSSVSMSSESMSTELTTYNVTSTNISPITSDSMIINGDIENKIDIGLIGGVVGGVLILVIVIIVIIVCIVRHRKKKNGDTRDYCRPTETRSEHGYTDINLQAKGNNSSPGSVMIDNVPHDSADLALPQQPNNSEKTGNGPVEMEIIENDLYVSSSDIDDFKSRDGNITNHNPELSNDQSEMEIIENDLYVSSDDLDDHKSRDGNITNHNPELSNDQSEMEIIENDLYVSSDDVLNSTSNDDNAPVYAVVSKKSKRPKSDVNDNSKDIVQNDLVISL